MARRSHAVPGGCTMKFESKYGLGQFVYLRTGRDRENPWMVTDVRFSLDGGVVYTCTFGTEQRVFYEKELMDGACYALRPSG